MNGLSKPFNLAAFYVELSPYNFTDVVGGHVPSVDRYENKISVGTSNSSLSHVAPNQVKDATDEDFENIFQRAAFFQTLLKNFLEVTRS